MSATNPVAFLNPNWPDGTNNPAIKRGQLWAKYLLGDKLIIPNCRFQYYAACEDAAKEIVQNEMTGQVATPNGVTEQNQAYFIVYPISDSFVGDERRGFAFQNVTTEMACLHVALYRTDLAQAIARENTRKLLTFYSELQSYYVASIDLKNQGFYKNWTSNKDVEVYASTVTIKAVLPYALGLCTFFPVTKNARNNKTTDIQPAV